MIDIKSQITQDNTLKQEVADALLEELQLPVPFPQFDVCDHDSRTSWVSVATMFELASSLDEQDIRDNIPRLLFEKFAIDVMELIVDGDKQSDDKFLALFDGLKKRTVWPEQIWVSRRVDVLCTENTPDTIRIEITLRISEG